MKNKQENGAVTQNPYIEINNLYAIVGRKQVELEAFQNVTKALQSKVQELSDELKELKGEKNGDTGSD